MRTIYPEEKGKIDINGHHMKWVLRRSKGESAFGIRGSRIFELKLYKDDKITIDYGRGYSVKPDKEDDESVLCLEHLLNTYGKEKRKEKK